MKNLKTTSLVFLFLLLPLITEQFIFAQEPIPPPSPEPVPSPEPIYVPEPTPIPDPFPGLSDKEKIQQLLEENQKLKNENSKLESITQNLQEENNFLEIQINSLNKRLSDLQAVANEQIKVILDLLAQIKNAVITPTFSWG